METQFVCEGCGVKVRTYRWVSYRTIPPTRDDRDLCDECKEAPMPRGFKNEKELWAWQKKYLPITFERYELMTPAGHPDVKGSTDFNIIYIENKIGDYTTAPQRRAAMEKSQLTYLGWLFDCGQLVYVCFGSKLDKSAKWYQWPLMDVRVAPPPGWTGPE